MTWKINWNEPKRNTSVHKGCWTRLCLTWMRCRALHSCPAAAPPPSDPDSTWGQPARSWPLNWGLIFKWKAAFSFCFSPLLPNVFFDEDTGLQCPWHCGWDEINSHGLLSPVEEKGQYSHSLKGRVPRPLPWQAFISFLGTLHWGWSSFTVHRFNLGGYILQKTKERMLLITSKKKNICKCKGKSGWTGYTCP